jgi:hypothetical protein
MKPNYLRLNTFKPLLDILGAGIPVAVTAPLELEDELLVGYYSPEIENSGCAVVSAADAHRFSKLIYHQKLSAIRVHGLKRIWEALDIGARDVNLDLANDTKLMGYLLNPDACDRGLTLSALAGRYFAENFSGVMSKTVLSVLASQFHCGCWLTKVGTLSVYSEYRPSLI